MSTSLVDEQLADEQDENFHQEIDTTIQEIQTFLEFYRETPNTQALNIEQTHYISLLIRETIRYGTREQQWLLYIELLNTSASLNRNQLTELQHPIALLTYFFKIESPTETQHVDDVIIAAANTITS